MTSHVRRIAVVLTGGLLALVLSGCLVIQSQTSAQLNVIGNVQLTTTLCPSSSAAGTTCPDLGLSGVNAISGNGQALLGYRIPSAATGPASITSTDQSATLTPSATYAAELQRILPAPAGQKWVGYISQVRQFTPAAGVAFTFIAEFSLAQAADGGPFVTPFAHQVVSGFRSVSATAVLTRPVVCAAQGTFSDPQAGSATTLCVDSWAPAGVNASTPQATRDLGIVAGGATASVLPGESATLTFQAKYSGTATAAANFVLSATTTVPNTAATPNAINFAPQANQQAPVNVSVNVPAGTPPGTYDVTLKAALTNGQTRQGVGKLTVNAPLASPAPPPSTVVVNNPPPVIITTAPKRLNAKVRFRVVLGQRVQVLRLNVLGAPTKARINVKCVKGCGLNKASLSSGKTVNLTALFRGKTLKPGVVIEIRVTKGGFTGQFFRYTLTSSNIRGTECSIAAKGGKIGGCTPA